MNGYKNFGVFTQWSTSQLLETMPLWNSRKMDASREYHPEWGYPATKELTLYAVTDNWILTPESIEHPETTHRLYEVQEKQRLRKKNEKSLCLIFTNQENFD